MFNLSTIFSSLLTISIYSLTITTAGGNTISLSQFQGKKILLVNIATNSPRAGQLAKLEQLYQQHKDSLVVIAFPSNSFGNEPRGNVAIDSFCHNTYHVSFLVATKEAVSGTGIQPVYQWLTTLGQNGVMNGTILGDFLKFLVDKNGNLVGVFAPSVDLMGSEIQNAITGQ